MPKIMYSIQVNEFIRGAAMSGRRASEVKQDLIIKFPGIIVDIEALAKTIYNHRHHKEASDRRKARRVSEQAPMQKINMNAPPDTRNFTQRLLGDPLPGRSALDRSKKQHASSNT